MLEHHSYDYIQMSGQKYFHIPCTKNRDVIIFGLFHHPKSYDFEFSLAIQIFILVRFTLDVDIFIF